jgi:hypothetical protein
VQEFNLYPIFRTSVGQRRLELWMLLQVRLCVAKCNNLQREVERRLPFVMRKAGCQTSYLSSSSLKSEQFETVEIVTFLVETIVQLFILQGPMLSTVALKGRVLQTPSQIKGILDIPLESPYMVICLVKDSMYKNPRRMIP